LDSLGPWRTCDFQRLNNDKRPTLEYYSSQDDLDKYTNKLLAEGYYQLSSCELDVSDVRKLAKKKYISNQDQLMTQEYCQIAAHRLDTIGIEPPSNIFHLLGQIMK